MKSSKKDTSKHVQQIWNPRNFLRIEKKYEILKNQALGDGTYGRVYKAIKYGDDRQEVVAVKVMNVLQRKYRRDMTALKREFQSFEIFKEYPTNKYKNEHIVRIHDVYLVDSINSEIGALTQAYIFMDLADNNLEDELQNTGPMNDEMAKRYFAQIVYALDFLHFVKMAHRDIKLENLLMYKSDDPKDRMTGKTVKLTDFGLADLYFTDERGYILTERTGGTPFYKSPENP